jgi:hypothetical protein
MWACSTIDEKERRLIHCQPGMDERMRLKSGHPPPIELRPASPIPLQDLQHGSTVEWYQLGFIQKSFQNRSSDVLRIRK